MPAQRGINKYTGKETVGIRVPLRDKAHPATCTVCGATRAERKLAPLIAAGWQIAWSGHDRPRWLCPDHAGYD